MSIKSVSVKPYVRPQQRIVVEIKGDIHSGKSIVTAIVAQALHAHGFLNVEVVNTDGDLQHAEERLQRGIEADSHVLQNHVLILDENKRPDVDQLQPNNVTNGGKSFRIPPPDRSFKIKGA